jgi:hypothetical protein
MYEGRLMSDPVIVVSAGLVAALFMYQAWRRFSISGRIQALTKSVTVSSVQHPGDIALQKFGAMFGVGDKPATPLNGSAKKAHDILVRMGPRALPALRAHNQRLIAEHEAYSEWLKSGPSQNSYENYGRRTVAEKAYRYVIELRQDRIVDVIEAIKARMNGRGDR